jgi:hypothetical protein
MVVVVHTGEGAAADDTRVFVGGIPATAALPDADECPNRFDGSLQAFPELFAFLEPARTGSCVHPGELKFDGSESDRLLLSSGITACVRVEDHRAPWSQRAPLLPIF